jgi:hypothetical protein
MLPQYPGPPLTRLRSLLPQLRGVKQTADTAIRTLDKDTSGPAKEVASNRISNPRCQRRINIFEPCEELFEVGWRCRATCELEVTVSSAQPSLTDYINVRPSQRTHRPRVKITI